MRREECTCEWRRTRPGQLFVYKGSLAPEGGLPFNFSNLRQLNCTNMNPAIGPWRLRFLKDKEPTMLPLLFLTSNGLNNVVTIDPKRDEGQKVRRFNICVDCMINLVTGTVPRQWFALPVDEKYWYIITPDPWAKIPTGLARKGDTVVLSAEPDEWRLQYVPIFLAGGNVYESDLLLDFNFHRTDFF